MKTLVAYFSRSKQTERYANILAGAIGADLYEISPAQKYTAADLDWRDKSSRSSLEMADKSSRPQIGGAVNMAQYDKVLIGFPIWWYTAPQNNRHFFGKL